jgi:hypothetical protein
MVASSADGRHQSDNESVVRRFCRSLCIAQAPVRSLVLEMQVLLRQGELIVVGLVRQVVVDQSSGPVLRLGARICTLPAIAGPLLVNLPPHNQSRPGRDGRPVG